MAGRPMVYADIGGMSEKANPDADIPFSAGSPGALADVIRFLVERGEQLGAAEDLSADVRSRLAVNTENYDRHKVLYMRPEITQPLRSQVAG